MSSEDEKCFLCQATGHMAHYCPRIQCFNCTEYGHVAADCPIKIPYQVHLHAITNLTPPEHTGTDQPQGITHGTDKDSASPDYTHTPITTEVAAKKTSTDTAPSLVRNILMEAHHAIANPAKGATTMRHHTEGHSLHTEVPLCIHEITVIPGTRHLTDQIRFHLTPTEHQNAIR